MNYLNFYRNSLYLFFMKLFIYFKAIYNKAFYPLSKFLHSYKAFYPLSKFLHLYKVFAFL